MFSHIFSATPYEEKGIILPLDFSSPHSWLAASAHTKDLGVGLLVNTTDLLILATEHNSHTRAETVVCSPYDYNDILIDSSELFTIRGIKFDDDPSLQVQIATGALLPSSKTTLLAVIPRHEYNHGVQ